MLDWFIRLYGNYADRRAVEMTTRVLRGMSDAELQDIGITRGDIWAVARGKCGRTIKQYGVNCGTPGGFLVLLHPDEGYLLAYSRVYP